MDDTRTVSGFGITVAAQEYLLVDERGRTLAALSATQGKPVLTFYNGIPAQMATFEQWAEMSHEDHLGTIEMIEKQASRFIEIPPCSDGYDPVSWLKERAMEQGVKVSC